MNSLCYVSESTPGSYETPTVMASQMHNSIFPVPPYVILVALALVILFGAFAICVWNGYSGVSFWFSLDNQTAKLYCTA